MIGDGAPCAACGTSALDCQRTYVASGAWCCPSCRAHGARALHVTQSLVAVATDLTDPARRWRVYAIVDDDWNESAVACDIAADD